MDWRGVCYSGSPGLKILLTIIRCLSNTFNNICCGGDADVTSSILDCERQSMLADWSGQYTTYLCLYRSLISLSRSSDSVFSEVLSTGKAIGRIVYPSGCNGHGVYSGDIMLKSATDDYLALPILIGTLFAPESPWVSCVSLSL